MSEIDPILTTDVAELGRVTGFELEEALDRPYVLRIHCRSGTALDAAALEQNVVLEYGRRDATRRRVTGMILAVKDQPNRLPEPGLEIQVGPALTLLDLTRTSRIFQDMSVPDILREVLEAELGIYGRSVDIQLTETYEPREYCVQWQETTLEFAQRLMAEEGIAYYFDHAGGTEVLALRDKNDRYPELAANAGATVVHTPQADTAEGIVPEAVTAFRARRRLGRTHVAVRDYDWSGPRNPEGTSGEADAKGRERESFEHALGLSLSIGSYDEGAKRYQKEDSARQYGLRLEADRATLNVFDGESTIPSIAPGQLIDLTDEPTGLDGRYLVLETHTVYYEEREGRQLYRFSCAPVDVPYRPARVRAKPKITSAEVATVVGPSGEEIHTDAHGRIKVRFGWDRGDTEDPRASCWMRVAQRWAGGGFGTLHIPRIGMEVVVRYMHGDPDRPIVTGALYRGDNPPPYPLPADKTKSTIKSNSSIGGGGFNEFRFEDKAGQEQIFLHAQKNLDEVVLANHTTTVGVNQKNSVHNDQTQTIHTNQKEDVHANQVMRVKGKRDVTVLSGFEENVDGTETRKVKAGVTEVILGDQKRTVKTAVNEHVIGGEKRAVIGGQIEKNDATHARAVFGGALRVDTGAFTHTACGDVRLQSSGSMINNVIAGSLAASGGPTVHVEAPVIIEFSSQHKTSGGGSDALNTKLQIGIFGLVLAATGAKASLGALSVTIAGGVVALSDLSASVTRLNVGLTASNDSNVGATADIIGLLINVGPYKKFD